MGSMGSGRFGEQNGAKQYNKDRCLTEIPEIQLEDVVNCEYYLSEGEVPGLFREVFVPKKLKRGRLTVIQAEDNTEIGLIPSQFNYLYTCLLKGHSYRGNIVYIEDGQFPKVVVKLDAK
ncbi:hypothetical protein [Ornithinibacillus sp. 179-J 7C1 HS]|uniref:hypothetical protein n=1 Tax=Ornithinibacillus sp. 179-J 7C1 HS TaxID=3142384 RepID=UPI0039A1E2C3